MSRLWAVALVLTMVPMTQVFAQGTALEKTILDLETKRIDAMVKKDVKALDALLADDLTYTHSGGSTDTKSSFIALIRDRGRYLGIDYPQKQVIPSGESSVIIRGVAVIRLENTAPYSVYFLDVWSRRSGVWKMVAWQATRVVEPTSTR